MKGKPTRSTCVCGVKRSPNQCLPLKNKHRCIHVWDAFQSFFLVVNLIKILIILCLRRTSLKYFGTVPRRLSWQISYGFILADWRVNLILTRHQTLSRARLLKRLFTNKKRRGDECVINFITHIDLESNVIIIYRLEILECRCAARVAQNRPSSKTSRFAAVNPFQCGLSAL